MNSKLNSLFDLSIINWDKCGEYACSSLVKEVCNYWANKNNKETTTDLCEIFKLGRPCIIKYLKIGNSLGWCIYNANEERNKTSKLCGKLLRNRISKKVIIFKQNKVLGIFYSGKELERKSLGIFGIKLNQANISESCIKNKEYKKHTFKYIEDLTPKEYIKYDIENKLKELHNQELGQDM